MCWERCARNAIDWQDRFVAGEFVCCNSCLLYSLLFVHSLFILVYDGYHSTYIFTYFLIVLDILLLKDDFVVLQSVTCAGPQLFI